MTDPVPLRERIRDRQTGRTHEILARDASVMSDVPLIQGAKVILIRDMLNARGGVILESELAARFIPVDPSEPIERSRLHVVPKPEEGR